MKKVLLIAAPLAAALLLGWYFNQPEEYQAPEVVQTIEIDTRDEHQKLADRHATFARQLVSARELRAQQTIMLGDATRTVSAIRQELVELEQLEQEIKESMDTVALAMQGDEPTF